VFSYEYDPAGHIVKRTYPDGTVVDYAYNDEGRLSSVTSGGATTSYVYDVSGNLIETRLPLVNGHVETRGYDRAGRHTEVRNTRDGDLLSMSRYDLDPVGNPLSMETADGTVSYRYDSLDRLIEACYGAVCGQGTPFVRYYSDPVGNRLKEERSDDGLTVRTTEYVYNLDDELTVEKAPSGSINYDHDRNGNMRKAGAKTYEYGLAGQMTKATIDGNVTSYTYDGDGGRVGHSSGPAAADQVNYTWDVNAPLPELISESDGDDTLRRRYIHGKDLISMSTGAADFYYHHDGLGSVTNVTDGTGLPQWAYSYEPFGNSRNSTKINALAPDNRVRFTGEYLDPTGLYHLRARQYDPSLGRFSTIDPWTPPITSPAVSPYVYVNNRPTVLTDPSGRCPWCIGAVVGGVIGGVAAGFGAVVQGGDLGDVLVAAGTGAAGGALAGAFAPLATPLGGAAIGGVGNLGGQLLTGGTSSINECSIVASTLTGGLGSVIGAGAAGVASTLGGNAAAQAAAGGLGPFPTSVVVDPIAQSFCATPAYASPAGANSK